MLYKVCVYAICKNEEKFVDCWMDSMNEADMVVVTDTGSEDNTVDKLKARGAVVYVESIVPWRFDTARNVSLSHVPDNIDICVCTDLDEIFLPGWRENLEKAWNTQDKNDTIAKTGKYLYNWSLKADGTPDVQFDYFKVHGRQGFYWKYPVHECIMYNGKLPLKTIYINDMVLNHYPDVKKSRGSYLPLLEMAVSESPSDDRMNYYLGREYMYAGRWQDCINMLNKYLLLPSANWNEERCAAMRWIAKSFNALKNQKEAYSWYFRAIAEASYLRDPYIEFAKTAYQHNDWIMVFFLVEEALKIKNKSTTYVNMGYAWDHTPYDLGVIACYNLGLLKKSLVHAHKASELCPENKRLENNLKTIKEALENSH